MPLRGTRFSPTALGLCTLLIIGCGDDATEPQTGNIDVSLTMTGASPDANGCVVSVDGVDAPRLSDGERHVFGDLATGRHTVTIFQVASNCMVQGESSRSVLVRANETTTVDFALDCPPPIGLEVWATTAGSATDPDGYTVTLDGAATQLIGANDFVVFGDVADGEHVVELTGVAENCTVIGDYRITVDFYDSDEGTRINFGVACPPFYDHIAFTRYGSGGIHVMKPDGSNLVNLVPGPSGSRETFRYPAWAPDATRIAFTKDEDIWVLNTADMTRTQLTHGVRARELAWSPDGTRIAYALIPATDIYVMNADGTNPVNLTSGYGGYLSPAWSPDGSQIAFAWGDIWVMQADGSNPRRLTDHYGGGREPAWSPDGTHIAFAGPGEFPSDRNIWVVDADGSNLTKLTEVVAYYQARRPTWSPDGTRIAFWAYYSDDGGCDGIHVIPPGRRANDERGGVICEPHAMRSRPYALSAF